MADQPLAKITLPAFELIFLFRMEKLAASLNQTVFLSADAQQTLNQDFQMASVGEHVVPGYVDDNPRTFFGRQKT